MDSLWTIIQEYERRAARRWLFCVGGFVRVVLWQGMELDAFITIIC
jgi:hypothetical protein